MVRSAECQKRTVKLRGSVFSLHQVHISHAMDFTINCGIQVEFGIPAGKTSNEVPEK